MLQPSNRPEKSGARRALVGVATALVAAALASACERVPTAPTPEARRAAAYARREQLLAASERARQQKLGAAAIASDETRERVAAEAAKPTVTGTARFGVLYFLDRPAHRLAVRSWLTKHNARIVFEDQGFGYLDAELAWADLKALVDTAGSVGLDESSLMKLELDAPTLAAKAAHAPEDGGDGGNTSLFGPVHSAGYGAHVAELRAEASAALGVDQATLDGRTSLVAVYDGGIDLSRTDVFQDRIRDFLVGEDRNYVRGETTLAQLEADEHLTAVPEGLEDLANEPSLRFVKLSETELAYDLNGSGAIGDDLAVAIYRRDGVPEARVRPMAGLPFGEGIGDYGTAHAARKPAIVDLYTGHAYVRAAVDPSPSAAAFKFRTEADGALAVAFVGTANGSDHGIANLHMVGGDYLDRATGTRYQGVAPGVEFLAMATWTTDGNNYGGQWLPLARNIINAARAKADVIDLDIYTPGVRGGSDLLQELTCRVTTATTAVPVVAAHNFGPLPDTVQALAASPCVLGIGAAHSVAAIHQAFNEASVDPALTADDDVQTAAYSGRGFALNGLVKPDVISPAYGYTAYGPHFIRFSGTSGATPTTAGILALLKQAARLDGVDFDLAEARFLLQAASRPVAPQRIRDGFGFTDAAATFRRLHAAVDQATHTLTTSGFRLSGAPSVDFGGRPAANVIDVPLTRAVTGAAADGPEPMTFWIEYGGASPQDATWLKFYEASAGTTSATLAKDAPMTGESMTLRLYVDLDDAAWNALPAGDHVAIVKGVRTRLAGGRAADFAMPVTLAKAARVEQTSLALDRLYVDQYQVFTVAAAPGDTFTLEGLTTCAGRPIAGGVAGVNADGLRLVIDHEAAYSHGSEVMNLYAPLTLTPAPVAFTARKSLVRFAVVRYAQLNCDGPIGGTVFVRHTGFAASVTSPLVTVDGDDVRVSATATLTLTSGTLADRELARGLVWNVKAGRPAYVLRQTIKDDTVLEVPEGTTRIRVVPTDTKRFQAALTVTAADGAVLQESQTFGSDSGGFGSFNVDQGGKYTGLEVSSPVAGRKVLVALGVGTATLELVVAAPQVEAKLTAEQDIAKWLARSSKTVALAAKAPGARPAALAGLTGTWAVSLEVPYTIEESMPNSTGTAGYVPVTLWSGTFPAPLVWR
jgi:hypothetical protein